MKELMNDNDLISYELEFYISVLFCVVLRLQLRDTMAHGIQNYVPIGLENNGPLNLIFRCL
jgi:hypothetical protein